MLHALKQFVRVQSSGSGKFAADPIIWYKWSAAWRRAIWYKWSAAWRCAAARWPNPYTSILTMELQVIFFSFNFSTNQSTLRRVLRNITACVIVNVSNKSVSVSSFQSSLSTCLIKKMLDGLISYLVTATIFRSLTICHRNSIHKHLLPTQKKSTLKYVHDFIR